MKRAVGITRILLVAAIALLAGVSGARAQAGSATLNVMDRLEDSQFNGATINNCAFEVGDMLYVRVQLGPVVPGPGPQPPDMRITVRANGPAGVEDTETMTLRFFTEFPGASQNYWYAGFMPTARRPDNRPGFPWALTGNGTLELRGRNYIDFPDVNFIYPGATWTYINPAREIPAHCGAKLRFVRQDAFLPAPRQDNVTIPGELGLFPIGDTLYALLEDDDLNTDPASSQDVALGGGGGSTPPNVNPLPYLSDGAGPTAIPPADQEFFSGALQLHETGPDTGVFMSSIPSRFTVPTVFTSGNGVLEKTGYTAGNATVQFVYSDAHYPQTDRGNNVTVPQNNLTLVTLTRLITVERGATPTFTGTDANLALGQPFKIVVSDGGLNQPNSAVSEAVTVRAISYTDATQTTILDEETVVLGNTGTPSFAGQIRWVYQSPVVATTQRDGVLTVPRLGAAGTIRLYYYTPVGPDGEPYFRVTTTAGLAAVAAGASPEFLTREDVWASPLGAAPNNRVAPTDTLCVRINDPGLVTQPFPGTNTVTVTVDSNVHPNPQVLTAHEVATRPGWFIAQVPLSWGNPSLAPDGTLHVRGADLITAAYTDSFGNPQSAGNLPQVATAGAVTIREDPLTNTLPQPGDGGELKQLQAGQTFNIVVVDDDQNATAGIDQITGLAALRIQTYDQAYAGLELATTTLFETGPDTGVFTGRVSTRWATAATGVAGTVSVQGRSGTNNVSVTYIDPFPLTATASSSAGAEVAAGVTGLVALLPSPLYPGGSLTISVVDTDGWANVRPGPGNDTIQVTLTAYNSLSAVFDTQVVEVPEVPAEAGGTGGSFYMVVPTAFATVGVAADGVLQVTAGGSIRMGYVDAVTATGQTNAVVMATATVLYNPAAVVSVQFARDLNGTVYTGPIAPGDTLYIRVSDSNANVSGGIDSTTIDVTTRFDLLPAGLAGGFCDIETVRLEETGPNTVRVTSTDGVTTVDTELVTLTETGLNTGVFTNAGGLPSHYTLLAPDTIANDLGIRAGSGGQIQLGYFDLETTTAIATNRVELLPVNVCVTAVLITSPANGGNLNPSQNVSIAVYDNDVWANRSPGAGNDTVTVTMTSFTGGLGTIVVDQEVIQVPEDRLVAGVFQRWMPAEFVPNNTNPGFADGTRYDDGRIQVRLGGSVEVRYNDPVNVSGNVPLYSTATSAISNVFTAAFRLAGPANPILFVSDTFVPLSGPTSYVNRQVTAVGPGDTVNVSVTDPDFDLTPDVDTLLVAIASRTTNAAGPVVPPFTTAMDDLEWMPLTETGPRTGVFAGSMKTVIAPDAFSTVLRNNGNLEVRGHDFSSAGGSEPQVTAAYTDARAALQTRQLAVNIDGTVRFVENPRVADSAAALPGFQESPGAHLPGQISEIKAGEPLYLQLIDDDLNRDASTTDPVLPATLTVTV
ncbi:MAG: hypothetical protein HY815_01950, partial [Candidatus Riflebacteria bacterium]|nr:hypothetical protein [Candidatus Riflebacteria bacterium]